MSWTAHQKKKLAIWRDYYILRYFFCLLFYAWKIPKQLKPYPWNDNTSSRTYGFFTRLTVVHFVCTTSDNDLYRFKKCRIFLP